MSTANNQQIRSSIISNSANTFRYLSVENSYRSLRSYTASIGNACSLEAATDRLGRRLPIPLII
jgi:hypothetical protein